MSRPGAFTSQAVVLVLLEALTIAVAARDRGRALENTERMNHLREELNGYPLADETVLGFPRATLAAKPAKSRRK
jgi:hypothetical protein